jgi:alpha-beta hydrolase superfamily lysophospholipase
MFTGIHEGSKYALANAAGFPIPAFLAYAGSERIISNRAIFQFAADAGKMVKVSEYDSCHAIHNDVKHEEYFKDMIAFLDANCRGGIRI